METKNAKVRRLVKEYRHKEALQICKDWDYKNPEHREILRRGYECLMNPRFYEQIGFNPKQEYLRAVDVLHTVYGE